jgi:hypothetical protein
VTNKRNLDAKMAGRASAMPPEPATQLFFAAPDYALARFFVSIRKQALKAG